MIDVKSRGSGYYRVYVDDVEISQHITEREAEGKAIEEAINLAFDNPSAKVHYAHDYEVDVTINAKDITLKAISGGTLTQPDSEPDPIAGLFVDENDVPASTTRPSNEIQILGVDSFASVTIEVSGDGGYRLNGGLLTTAPGIGTLGDLIALEHQSNAGAGLDANTTLTLDGTVSDTFTSTTQAAAGDYSTIYGTGFGTKPASNIYYDDFETYPVGPISGVNNPLNDGMGDLLFWATGAGVAPVGSDISNTESYSGSQSMHHDFAQKDFPHFEVVLPTTNKKLYMGCLTKIGGVSASGNAVWKYARMGSLTPGPGGKNVYNGLSHAGESYTGPLSATPGDSGAEILGCDPVGSGGADVNVSGLIQSGVWQFYEHESFIGDFDVSNGFFTWRWDMQTSLEWSNINYLCSSYPNLPGWILFPLHGFQNPGSIEMWLDEYYVDDGSRARVIMTDNATYSSSTKWSHQIPVAGQWSDTQIEITTKRGIFTVGETAYLHIFDDDGTLVDSQGPVTVVADA